MHFLATAISALFASVFLKSNVEHMVVKVFKPKAAPPAKRKGGRHKQVPHNEVDGEWGPAGFTKQLMCYKLNYRATLLLWASEKHNTLCRGQ